MRRQTTQGMDVADRKAARAAMPDVIWTLLADPANRPMLALTLAGLVVIVFGPWALVRLAQRRAARPDVDAAE